MAVCGWSVFMFSPHPHKHTKRETIMAWICVYYGLIVIIEIVVIIALCRERQQGGDYVISAKRRRSHV